MFEIKIYRQNPRAPLSLLTIPYLELSFSTPHVSILSPEKGQEK
jgi:hypothetical protein